MRSESTPRAAIRIFTAGVVEALAEEAIHAVSPEVRCVWATGNPIRPSEALLCYESRGGPDDSSEQSRLRAPFGHTLTRTSALMVNQHTLISRTRNPRGSLADFLRKDALREHTARGNPNFTAGVVEALAEEATHTDLPSQESSRITG
jgi:hypothetical protein